MASLPVQTDTEELSGALSAEQKRVAELKAQAESVKKALEKEQDFVAKLKREMQMAASESALLVGWRLVPGSETDGALLVGWW